MAAGDLEKLPNATLTRQAAATHLLPLLEASAGGQRSLCRRPPPGLGESVATLMSMTTLMTAPLNCERLHLQRRAAPSTSSDRRALFHLRLQSQPPSHWLQSKEVIIFSLIYPAISSRAAEPPGNRVFSPLFAASCENEELSQSGCGCNVPK